MKFNLFADSVHGKKYRERGLPCQDFAATLEFGDVQAIAVADGHGGKDYFRSDTGARLAVETVFELLKQICDEVGNVEKIFDDRGVDNFKLSIVDGWREKVLADWHARLNTFDSEPRWQTVSDKYKARFTSDEKYIPVAYGTTLICAVSIGTQVLIAQIGDGTCVVLRRDGDWEVPVPPDKANFANVTTSLCDEDAFDKFRHRVLNCDENSPVAIFLSTDGLDDCYPLFDNEKHLFKFYRETVIDGLTSDGFDVTAAGLREDILPYMTERGSNDDISLAWLVTDDLNLLKSTVNEPQTQPIVEVQTQSPVEAQTQSPVEAQTQPIVEAQTQPTVEVQTQSPVEAQTQPTVEPQTQPPVEAQTQPTVEVQFQSTVEVQTQPTVEAQTQPPVEVQTQSPVEAQTQSTVEAQTQPTVEAQTQPPVEAQTQSTVEAQTQPPVEVQTQPPVEPQTQSTVEAQTQPPVEVQAQSTVEAQTQPTVEAQTQPTVTPQTQSTVEVQTQPTVEAQTQPPVEVQAQPTVEVQAQPTVEVQTQPTVEAQTQSSQKLTSPMVKPPPKVSPVLKAQDITILPPTVIPIDRKEPRQ